MVVPRIRKFVLLESNIMGERRGGLKTHGVNGHVALCTLLSTREYLSSHISNEFIYLRYHWDFLSLNTFSLVVKIYRSRSTYTD